MNTTEIINPEVNPVVPLEMTEESDTDNNEGVYFSPYEWKVFKEELKLGKDVQTALHNARYCGELKRRTDDIEAGRNTVTFTEEEFEEMINESNIP